MNIWLAALFVDSIPVHAGARMLLILPLSLAVAVVYKTLRSERISEIPTATLALWGTIVLGMYAVGVGLYLLFMLMV